MTPADIDGFQYSKNLEGTKTYKLNVEKKKLFQYSKNLEGTKTNRISMITICIVSV